MKRYINSAGNDLRKARQAQAGAADATPENLTALAQDRSYHVRERVAKNPNTPVDALIQLAEDSDPNVRLAVASNPSTPVDIVLKLLNNRYGYTGSNKGLYSVMKTLARNPNTAPEILKELFKFGYGDDWDVVELVAKNPNTPVRTLRSIYNKGYFNKALAKNPNTPKDIIDKIYSEGSREVRNAALKNPQVTGERRKQFLDQGHTSSFDQYVGKDIWVEGESYGISRDYTTYFKLISKKRKSNLLDEYTVSRVYEQWYKKDKLLEEMQETETITFGDLEEADAYIPNNPRTYTTEELIEQLT